MTGADDARRRPVWHALSELFLDTELTGDDYRRIARVLTRSGFPPDRLRQILAEEVAPAFAVNLIDVAGAWAPWDESDVAAIMARSRRSSAPGKWLWRRFARRHVAEEWAKIAPLLDAEVIAS
jgi:hypothetical protein